MNRRAEPETRPAHPAALAVAATVLTGTFGAEIADGVNGVLCWVVTTFAAGLFALRVARPRTPGLSRADFRQLADRRTAGFLLPAVILAGVLAGLVAYHVSQQISAAVTEGVAGAALATLLAGLTGGLWSHLHLNHLLTQPGSQVLAFILAVPCGVVLGSGGWLRVQIAAARSGGALIPRRPVSFLRWAEATGLLRAVGTSYQFRHDDLRVWLLSNVHPDDAPGRGGPG